MNELLGSRLREARLGAKLGVRELARRLEVSASLISQIELGRVVPSVSTLYALTNALGISMDSLFAAEGQAADGSDGSNEAGGSGASNGSDASSRSDAMGSAGNGPDGSNGRAWGAERHRGAVRREATAHERAFIQRRDTRRSIDLEQGVRWELLTPTPEPGAEFLEVIYPVGGSSSPTNHPMVHNGRDYCLILEGELSVMIGFEEHLLGEGDSFAFDATIPHRFWNAGREPVRAVWFVLDRVTARP